MPVLVVMGVSGSGKSTVAAELARELDADFQEGDELHPAANVAKMAAGHPLTDADRDPWLDTVAAWIDGERARGRDAVVTCSALRRRYRDRLRRPDVIFVYLQVDRDVLARRLRARSGHFMPAALLDSQLADLEPPEPDEAAITVTVAGDEGPAAVVAAVRAALAGRGER